MKPIHNCKCHARPYTVCPDCGAEYCVSAWPVCPRLSWHPAHGTSDKDIAIRYRAQQASQQERERRVEGRA